MQRELAENCRASEADRNELVAAKMHRQLAEKERDELVEKCRQVSEQRESLRSEAEDAKQQLNTLKVCCGTRLYYRSKTSYIAL